MSLVLTSCLALEYLHHVFMLFQMLISLVSSLCLLQLLYPLPSAKLRAFHVAGVRFMYIEIELNQYLQEHFDKSIRGIIVLDMWPNYSKIFYSFFNN